MTKIIFKYNPAKEFDNFKNTSVSVNNPEPTPVFKLYLKKYKKLEKDKIILFAKNYLVERRIDIKKTRNEISKVAKNR